MEATSRMSWARHVAHMGDEKSIHVNWKTQKQLYCEEFQAFIPSLGVKIPDNGTNRSSQNVDKKLPLHTV
jgi:hypothetical protein